MTESQFWIALREYPGGILQFERDFQTEFIAITEQGATEADSRFFLGDQAYRSVYELFARENYTIADVDAIGHLPKEERIAELFAYGLMPAHFDRWYEYVLTARRAGTLRGDQSQELFSDVMKRIFLAQKLSGQ
jgi:hypothetical protein